MITIDPASTHHVLFHRLLSGTIAPRPIAFVSTIDREGKPNLSPFSFFNIFGVNPSTLIFSPARRGRDNTVKDTLLNVKEIPEAVINVVTWNMVEQANLASNEFPRGTDEFIKSGFTPVPSEHIRPFRVKESPVQLECKVRQVIETSDTPGAANLVICEVLLVHVSKSVLEPDGSINPHHLDLVGRLGGDYYVRASGKALFTVNKPGTKPAIGIDALPESIRLSKVLTGNDLGRLGNLPDMPTAVEVSKMISSEFFRKLKIRLLPSPEAVCEHIHRHAQKLIKNSEVDKALLLLLACDRDT